MYAILMLNNEIIDRRFPSEELALRHIRRFFREEDGDTCIVIPIPGIAE